ncbi:hypothetical protein TruAng_009058 [Truncatella angustata]|nr:hypothetical protein TruAng_009058 [Truncatella angustata]
MARRHESDDCEAWLVIVCDTAPREILRWDTDTTHTQSMSDLFRGYDHVLDQYFEQLVQEIKECQTGGGFLGGTAKNRAHKEYPERTCPDASLEEQGRCKKN